MYTENDRTNAVTEGNMDSADDVQEKSLRWLLEMDLEEPEEKLFSVSGDAYMDQGLSDYEAEVASRPMFRGSTTSDDLATYVAEEIVMSSDSEKSDIYSSGQSSAGSDQEQSDAQECMAVDYSLGWHVVDHELLDQVVVEGADILGLSADDDIGEKFLAIKRVKRPREEPAAAAVASADSESIVTAADQGAADATAPDAATGAEDAAPDNRDLVEPVEYDLSCLNGSEQAITPPTDTDAIAGSVAGDEPETIDFDLDDVDMEQAQAAVTAQDIASDQPLELSEAPVPYLVAAPGSYTVANEGAPHGEPELSSSEAVAETDHAGDVVAYISNNQPPVDDDAFDQYLLAGEHLQSVLPEQEELVVETTDGTVSVDPSDSAFIDYHEDFLSMEGVDRGDVSAIAGVISGAMEEISQLARARIRERGLAADALAVDVMLGTDAESIKRCYAEGFEPVTAICQHLPEALRELQQPELDTIYLRLFNGQTNENWNDLFSSDTLQEDSDIDDVFDDLLAEEGTAVPGQQASGEAAEPNGVDWLAVEGFAEDSLEQDFSLGFDALPAEQELDIDEVFADMGSAPGVADEICGVDVGEFALAEQTTEPVEELPPAMPPQPPAAQPEPVGSSWCIPEGVAFSHTSQSTTEIFSDFLDAFIEESTSEVEKLEDAFGEWEKNPADEAALAPVARTLHTLKGIAKGVGLQRYGTLIHNFETLLEAMPRPREGLEGEYFRMVNAWLDAAVRGLEFVQENRCDVASEFPAQALVVAAASPGAQELPEQAEPVPHQEAAQVVAAPQRASESNPATALRQKKRDQQLADEGAKALAAQQSVRITAEKLDLLLNLTSQAQQLGVRSAQSTTRGKRAAAELQGRLSSVRAQIATIADRSLLQVNSRGGRITPDLDALEMDQYSELQEAASILREGVEDLADLVELANRQNNMVEMLLKQQAAVITSISSSIQAARVVPVSRLMPGLRRIVRTVSTDLDKSVSFKVLNEAGALDRDHYARCQIILEHMVRNALDHGIEVPQERLALGKPTAGRITIDVRKSGGDYIIRLSDDGRGIDPDTIRESAYKKRLDVDLDKMTDDQVMRLIFHKGFSTANTLSEISGRGVGMDIVMSELQQLGGDIQIQSTVGLGTCFEIRIPANVTVNGALLVAAGEQSYAIPLNGLIAVEQVLVQDFYQAVEDGTTLSLFDMDCAPAYLATLCQGERLPDRSTWGATVPVIIAGTEERYMAIAIDNVEEALELVVRSLGSQFSGVPGLAGAATTADGEAIVALDLNLLVGSADADGISTIAVDRPEEGGLLALVVDDSRTQRMVATSQLDTVGVETVTAENGMVAIDLLNTTHRLPDVVLLDVEMPVQDGIETLREIRKSRRFGHLPVIMVTSRTGTKHRALAREAGCNGYMGKPFNFPALVERISELTGHELHLS